MRLVYLPHGSRSSPRTALPGPLKITISLGWLLRAGFRSRTIRLHNDAFGPVFDIRNTLVLHPRETLDGIQAQNLFQIAGSAIVAMVLEMREKSGKIG